MAINVQQCSIVATAVSSGAVVVRVAYHAYGQPPFSNAAGTTLSSSAKATRYSYTGREWDPSLELHHFRARWMNGVSGRFLGRDPIGFKGGFNQFGFLGAHSLVSVDPSGLEENKVPKGKRIPLPFPPFDPGIDLGPFPTDGTYPDLPSDGTRVWPHSYSHQDGKRRCIFVMEGWDLSQHFDGVLGIPLNGGERVTNVKDGSIIADTINRVGCCEILVLGHQGGNRNPGGIESDNKPIFPSANNDLESKIREALKNRCERCDLFIFGCGSSTPTIRDSNRDGIAKASGCDVYGSYAKIPTGDTAPYYPYPDPSLPKDTCTMNPKKWNKKLPNLDTCSRPWPMLKYPSTNPLH